MAEPLLPRLRPAASPSVRVALAACAALAALGACGEQGKDAAGPPAGPAVRPPARWSVQAATPEEQARFALERLLRGPVVQELLNIPEQHAQTLRMAMLDLLALPLETLALFADPALIARVTGPEVTDLNPWHNLLEVLAALPSPEPGLVRRWTEPLLARNVPALDLRAVSCLAATRSPEVGPLALRFLEHGAEDRNVSRESLRLLARLPAPWPRRALEVVFQRGSPFAWLAAHEAIGERGAGETLDPGHSDLLAWWALLVEGSGPRPATGSPRVRTLPYTEVGLARLEAMGEAGRPRAPGARELDERGWFATDLTASAELPLLGVFLNGQEPAARARCLLAGRRHEPYVSAVLADRASADPLLREQATHCMLPGERGVPTATLMADTEAFLARLQAPEPPALTFSDVAQAQRRLPPADSPAAVALLERVLREARPMGDLLLLIESAHDALRAAGRGEDEAAVLRLLGSAVPEDRGLGMHLAQRSRKGVYLEPLLKIEAVATPAGKVTVRRAVQWIVSGGDIAPAALEAYVRRFAAWLDESSDSQLLTLASGLLDLGPSGVEALLPRVAGPRRALYLQALRDASVVLPLPVAEALCDQIDATLPVDLRREVYLTLWRAAPAQACGALAAAKSRIDPAERAVIDVVLEVVRHRAAR